MSQDQSLKQFLLAVHYQEGVEPPSADEAARAARDVAAFNEKLQAAGVLVFAGGLQTPDEATVVEVEDEDMLLQDGPFSPAPEQLGGFWVVRAVDHDAALDLAARAAAACGGPVEVRPFEDEPAA